MYYKHPRIAPKKWNGHPGRPTHGKYPCKFRSMGLPASSQGGSRKLMIYETAYPKHEYRLPGDFELGMREQMLGRNATLEAFHNARIRFANLFPYDLRSVLMIMGTASAVNEIPHVLHQLHESTPLELTATVAGIVTTLFSRRFMGRIPSAKILERRMGLTPTPYTTNDAAEDDKWVRAESVRVAKLLPSGATMELGDMQHAIASFAQHNLGRVRVFPRIKNPLAPPYHPQYVAPTGEILINNSALTDPLVVMEELMHAQGVFREPPANMAVIVACLQYGTPPLAYGALLHWQELIKRYRTKMGLGSETTPPQESARKKPPFTIGVRIRDTAHTTAAYFARRTPGDLYQEYTLAPLALLHAWRVQYRRVQDKNEGGI